MAVQTYRVLEQLGEGSQGKVFKALRADRAAGLKQIVALKILHSKTAVDMWRHEFESLSRVRSPYCVQVLSFERRRGRPTLILEYVEGVSLQELAAAGPLAETETRELLAQIEQGLRDLHANGIVHGDLSLSNVLVDSEGRVRLLDFGLANSAGRRLTPQFAAPECLQGAPPSHASDLFSLGKILQVLHPDSHFLANYIAALPADRGGSGLQPEIERRQQLRERVDCLRTRRRLLAAEHTHGLPATQLRPKARLFKALLGITIMTALVLLPAASHSRYPVPLATLAVRTSHWCYISIDGRGLGYAPLVTLVNANQEIHLRWTSARGHGERRLSLRPQQVLQLHDSDFLH